MGCGACGGKTRKPLMPARPASQVTQRPSQGQDNTGRQNVRNRISGLKWQSK